MYESPIEKIYGEIQTQMMQEDEKMVMEAIRNVGVTVDKEELIKALKYDRNQYTKGYEDGENDVLDKIRAEIKTMSGDIETIADVLAIIDKYKAESEDTA
jgi:hypothetical protein